MTEPDSPSECPFLIPVTADRLWLYPTGAYCRPPGHRVRVPAGATIAGICTTPAHLVCPGYLGGRDRRGQEPKPAGTREVPPRT